MKRIVLSCLLVTCAACTGPAQQAPTGAESGLSASSASTAADKPASAPAQSDLQQTVAASPVYSRLPDQQVKFDFDLKLKSDKQSVTANGKARRGLALQYSGLPAGELWTRVDGAFQRAGYAARGVRLVDKLGTAKQTYAKNGQSPITVSVPSSNEGSAGSGVMWLGWDI